MSEVIKSVKSMFDSLSEVFRHLVPGIMIIAAAFLSHPKWFDNTDIAIGKWLILLATIAIMVGSIWFVFHRYFIQQLVDVLFYLLNIKGGPCRNEKLGYPGAVARHVSKFFKSLKDNPELGRHIRFRTSSVVLMYITSETAFVFAISPADNSWYSSHHCFAKGAGIVCFLAAMWQNSIVRRIEGAI
jgi:hypothetical protein